MHIIHIHTEANVHYLQTKEDRHFCSIFYNRSCCKISWCPMYKSYPHNMKIQGILVFSCLLFLMGQEILALTHDSSLNDFILASLLKDSGKDNHCDVLVLSQDHEDCNDARNESKQDPPCYLELGNALLQHVEASILVRCLYSRDY